MREHSVERYERIIRQLTVSIEILCSINGRAYVSEVLALRGLRGKGYRVLVVSLAKQAGYRVVAEGRTVAIIRG